MSIPFHYILLHPTLVGCIPISIYCIIPWCPMTYQHILLIKNTPNDGQKIGVSPTVRWVHNPYFSLFFLSTCHFMGIHSHVLFIGRWAWTMGEAMAFHGHKWWRIFCGNLQDGLCSHHETVRYIYNRPSLSVGCFSQLSYLL